MRKALKPFLSRILPAGVYLLLALCVIVEPQICQAQTDAGEIVRIDEIQIIGNTQTRDYIIRRQLTLHPGDTVDSTTLEFNRKRVQNLNLFNRVQFFLDSSNDKNRLIISVTERWYIIPYWILQPNEGTFGKLSYGAGITIWNFRGRNETLAGSGWAGYNPGFALSYANPWIGDELKLSILASASIQSVENRSILFAKASDNDFDRDFTNFSLIVGKRYGLYFHTSINLAYAEVSVADKVRSRYSASPLALTQSPNGRDRMPSVGFSVWWDSRDLIEFPERGWYTGFTMSRTGLGNTVVEFQRLLIELKRYQPVWIDHLTLALRSYTVLSDGDVPVHSQVHFGYDLRVRGSGIRAGADNISLMSAELRYPIIPIKYYSWGDAPQASKTAFKNMKLGLSGTLFVDYGQLWGGEFVEHEKFNTDQYEPGYGAGLNIHIPGAIGVWRVEVGFDRDLKQQFFGISAYASF